MRILPLPHRTKLAFSLVELSIVLVILGLLVGGVLSGQSLIRAAEMRAVSTEYSRYIAAVQSFRDKYFALPGDMTSAQSFWDIAHATAATCVTTQGTGMQTCNGDGDGLIDISTGSNERFRFWQHLANAGLIEGTYSGITDGGNSFSATTNNSPKSKVSNSLWYIDDRSTVVADGTFFAATYGNMFELGRYYLNQTPFNPAFKPDELWNIGTKRDDGMPAQGKLIARRWATCTDAVDGTVLTASYSLTSSAVGCVAIFRQVF